MNTRKVDNFNVVFLKKEEAEEWKQRMFVGYVITFCDLPLTVYRCSLRAQWVAQHKYLYSGWVHTFISMTGGTVGAAACILRASSGKIMGGGGTTSFM